MTATLRQVRVATMNLQSEVESPAAAGGLAKVRAKADIVCGQEWKANRNGILERQGVLLQPRREIIKDAPTTGWAFLRGHPEGGTFVGADLALYQPISCSSVVLAKGRDVEDVPGRRSALGNTRATETIWRDRLSGREIAVISIHLPSHVQSGPGQWIKGARTDMHHEAVAELERLEAAHRAAGRTVLICGDTNVDGLEIQPLVACWDGHRKLPTHGGAHGRTIDYIYGPAAAHSVDTLVIPGDHKAVVATYQEAA